MPLRPAFTLELIALRGGPGWFTEVVLASKCLAVHLEPAETPWINATFLALEIGISSQRV